MSDLNLAIKLTTEGGKIVVKDLQQIDAAADKVNHSLGNTGKSGTVAKQGLDQATIGSNALTSSLKSTIAQAAGIIGLGVAINSLTRAVIDVGNVTTGWDAAMQSITGSQELANKGLSHSRELAKKLGLDIRSTTESYVQFTAATQGTALEGFKTNKVFDAVSTAMRVLNRSADDTSGALKALEQMVSKGNVQAEELRGQLGERLPGAFNLAAKAMGKTTQELNKMLENGEVLAADLLPKLADELTKKYGPGMAIALNTPAQAFRNLNTQVFEFNEALSTELFGTFASGAQTAADSLDVLSDNLPEILSILELMSVVVGGHLVKALIASGQGIIANTLATNAKLQANIKLQASELLLAESAKHKAIQEQLAAKRALALANTTYARSRAITNLAVANGRAIASERALTAATLAHNSAMKKANVTSRALSSSMALLGGPVGVVMLAAYALYEMHDAMGQTKTGAEQLEEVIGKTTKAIEEMTPAEQLSTQAAYKKLINEKKAAIEELKALAKEQAEQAKKAGGSGLVNTSELKSSVSNGQAEKATKELEALKNALSAVEGALFDAGMASIQWNKVIVDGVDLAKEKADAAAKLALNEKKELTTNQKLIASLEQELKLSKLTGLAKLEEINLSKLSDEIKTGEIAKVKELTAALYEQQQITAQKQDDSEYYQSVIDGANDISDSWNVAGNVIVNTFGTIGEQLEKLAQQQESYANKQKKLAADKIKYADDPKKLNEIAKAEKALAKQKDKSAMSEISSYRAITDAAANMFSENSKGRKAMQAASDVFTAVELANSAIRLGSYAVEAVAAAFAAPWPIGFASGASMIAIMAGLGVAVSGGSGSAPMSSAERQETQSTGTLLGSDDKSASLLNSFERIEDLELDQYAELQQMNASLNDLNNNITNLAVSLVRNFGKFDDASYGGQLGKVSTTSKFEELLLGGVVGQFAKALDPFGIIDKIFGGFSSKKKTLVDSGISIVSQTMGQVIDSGLLQARAYFDVKTKKKKFWGLSSSTSYDTEYQSVDSQIEREMALIFGDIASSINNAVDVLGIDVTRNLENFVINLPNLSFKDLSGDEIQAELEAMFSSQADLMATYLIPGLGEFQQVGEGLYETLIRIAQEQAVFNSVLELTGNTLANVDAFQMIEASQAIIGYAGSIENLQSAASSFFSEFYTEAEQFEYLQKQLNEQFEALGVAIPKTRQGFKDLVSGLDPLNEADQKLYAQLLLLSEQTSEYYNALEQQEQALKNFNENVAEQLQLLDFTPLQNKLHSLQKEFDQYKSEAQELGADTALLEQLYAKKRQSIIEDALNAVNENHKRSMSTLTREHESAVNELVNNNARLVSAFSSLNASIASNILSIRRQGSNWNEGSYQSSQISDLSSMLGEGSVEDQISNIDNLQQAYVNKYNAELAALNASNDAAQRAHDQQLANIESRYQAELEVYNNMRSALDSLKDAVDNLLLSDLSTLTNEQRLAEAKSQYESTLLLAKRGDSAAISNLSSVQSNYLSEAQSYYASSDAYSAIFDRVLAQASGIASSSISAPSKQSAPPVPASISAHNAIVQELQTSTVEKLKELQELSKALEEESKNAFDLTMSDLVLQFNANQESLIAELAANTLEVNEQAAALSAEQNLVVEQASNTQTTAINNMNANVVAELQAVRSELSSQTQAANARAAQAEQQAADAVKQADDLRRQLAAQARIQERQTDELMRRALP